MGINFMEVYSKSFEEQDVFFSNMVPNYKKQHEKSGLDAMRVSLVKAESDYERRENENLGSVGPNEKQLLFNSKRAYVNLCIADSSEKCSLDEII